MIGFLFIASFNFLFLGYLFVLVEYLPKRLVSLEKSVCEVSFLVNLNVKRLVSYPVLTFDFFFFYQTVLFLVSHYMPGFFFLLEENNCLLVSNVAIMGKHTSVCLFHSQYSSSLLALLSVWFLPHKTTQ